jgi:hypothetical protein
VVDHELVALEAASGGARKGLHRSMVLLLLELGEELGSAIGAIA